MDDRRRAVDQLAGTLSVVVVAAGGLVAGVSWAAWLLGAGVLVAFVVLLDVWACAEAQQAQVRALIASGGADVPLRVVRRARDRLASARRRAEIAGALVMFGAEPDASSAAVALAGGRVHAGRAASAARSELREIAELIRADDSGIAGLALAERLVTDGASSLYGDDGTALKQDLGRVRFLLHGGSG
jgi:hypothetical protein